MKVGSDPNYTVRMRGRASEAPAEQRSLYAGMYTFDLNEVTGVSFVPRVTEPPWSLDGLPADDADLTTAEQVRIVEVLTASYSVTPDDTRAGTVERFEWPLPWPDEGDWRPTPTVFLITTDEFDLLATDLADLGEVAGNVHPLVRRDQLADHEVVKSVDEYTLDSPWLTARDAAVVGREQRSIG